MREKKIHTTGEGSLRVTAKCPADQFNLAIQGSSHAMNSPYEGTPSAPDHPHPDFSLHKLLFYLELIFKM
jgi:hypothetical protein